MTAECLPPPSQLALLVDGPISSLVIVAGIIGNIYSLKQLFSHSITTSMLVSLTGLAIWDIVLLIAAFGHHSVWATMHYFSENDRPFDDHISILNGAVECGHITSTWMLIEVTAERFFAVTRPFQFATNHRKQRRKSYAKVVAGLIRIPFIMTVVACFIAIPCSFEYDVEPCMYKGAIYQQKHETALMRNVYYKLLYKTIFISISKTFAPFIIITLLTISMLRGMRKSMDTRASILMAQGKSHLFQSDCDKTKSLHAISIMLLGKFLLLRCWPTTWTVIQVLVGESNMNVFPFDFSHFFFLLNSATNSFVFVVVKTAFETRRNKRARAIQRQLVAQHAEAVLNIGKALAGDKLLLISHTDCENISNDEQSYEMQPMIDSSQSSSNPV